MRLGNIRGRCWVGVGVSLVLVMGVGFVVWRWVSSAPECRARGFLESLVDGDLEGV